MSSIVKTNAPLRRKITLQIINGKLWQEPCIEGDITLETSRKASPGVLKFKVIKDDNLNFQEGNPVKLIVDGVNLFFGFVFSKSRDKEQIIDVTAYDQLRYLKNKDYMVYKNKTAGALLKLICDKFNLKWGHIDDTKYSIPQRIEDNKSMFDIMQYAIEETNRMTKNLYVLYDDFGKLALKSIKSLKLDLLIDEETGENFDYKTSIDGETYNQIKLTYDDKKSKKREVYIAKDSDRINQWGLLQYTATIDNGVNGKAKADSLLELYNSKTRNLTIKDAFGDLRVRGGCMVAVRLSLGDINVFNYMMVEKVKHTFSNGHHSMDLSLSGSTQKGVQFSV